MLRRPLLEPFRFQAVQTGALVILALTLNNRALMLRWTLSVKHKTRFPRRCWSPELQPPQLCLFYPEC